MTKEKNKSEDILYVSDYILENFPNHGDSGELYLATNKKDQSEKYILKHQHYDCACNEFMYYKIGTKLGVNIAPVKLFIVNDNEDKFKTPCVCGIKYLENSEHVSFKYVKENKNNIKNWQDYIKFISLESMFQESDGIEVLKYKNEIYRIDTTDSFVSEYFIGALFSNTKSSYENEIFTNLLLKSAERNSDFRLREWNMNLERFIKNYGKEYLDIYLETFKNLDKISDGDIKNWTRILENIYSPVIERFFTIYFEYLNKDIKNFLKNLQNNWNCQGVILYNKNKKGTLLLKFLY